MCVLQGLCRMIAWQEHKWRYLRHGVTLHVQYEAFTWHWVVHSRALTYAVALRKLARSLTYCPQLQSCCRWAVLLCWLILCSGEV